VSSPPIVRAPQQARSRQSFERALDAAVALLVERGSPSFTLVEVAHASGVSTGSMYGRIASKDDLIRAAHDREMQRISAETVEAFAAAPVDDTDARRVRFAIGALAGLLERNAPVLSPFMLLANHDDVIASRGKTAFVEMTTLFEDAMLGTAMASARRRRAVRWSCTVVYSVLARQLALGSDPGAAADYRLDQVVSELIAMITVYLDATTA
jgi:AcrR family transcriptional regulator